MGVPLLTPTVNELSFTIDPVHRLAQVRLPDPSCKPVLSLTSV
jgi:hypothetical protein